MGEYCKNGIITALNKCQQWLGPRTNVVNVYDRVSKVSGPLKGPGVRKSMNKKESPCMKKNFSIQSLSKNVKMKASLFLSLNVPSGVK